MKTIWLVLLLSLLCICGYAQKLERFSENDKYGLRDADGTIVVPAKYEGIGDFTEGMAKVWIVTGLPPEEIYGYIDESGNEVIPPKYGFVEDFSEGLAPVVLNGKCGYVDKTGQEVIPLKYDDAENFSEGLAPVMLFQKPENPLISIEAKWGYIDKTGQEVIPLKYKSVWGFSGGFARVGDDYVDKTGAEMFKPVLAPYLKEAYPLSEKRHKRRPFKVKKPYLIVSGAEKSIEVLKYSESDVTNPHIMNQVKTLVVRYDNIKGPSKTYKSTGSGIYGGRTGTGTSHGTTLIYFDMDTKKFLGCDIILPDELPESVTRVKGQGFFGHFYISIDKVIKTVESHLEPSAE